MDETTLTRDLHEILGLHAESETHRRALLTPCMDSLGQWLQTASSTFTNGGVPTQAMIGLMQVALTAVLQCMENNGTLPPAVVHWITGTLVPHVFSGSDMSPWQRELSTIVVQIMNCLSKKSP